MELNIDGIVIPQQDLDGKLAWIAKIRDVYACDADGIKSSIPLGNSEQVVVEILNKSTSKRGLSGILYSQEDYKRLQIACGVNSYEDLLGKPVVSVYDGPTIPTLTGLIPLDLDG